MREYLSLLTGLLDRGRKRRLLLAGLWSLVLAALEALGLVLIGPLVLLLTASASHSPVPHTVTSVTALLGLPRGSSATALTAWLAALVFLAFAIKSALAIFVLRSNIGQVLAAEGKLSARLLDAYLHAPYPFHLQRHSAELQQTVQDSVRRVYQEALIAVVGAQADAVVMIVVLVVLAVLQPLVAAVAIAYFTLVATGYQRLIHGRVDSAAQAVQDDSRHAFGVVQQSLAAVKELLVLQRQELFVSDLAATKQRLADRQRTLILIFQLPRYYLEVALIIGFGVIGVVVFTTRSTADAIAGLALFLAAGLRLLPSLNRILVAAGAARAAVAPLRRVADDLDQLPRRGPEVSNAMEPITFDRVRFECVSFRYPNAPGNALRAVTMDIRQGCTVGIVGPSGAGKSTFLDLTLGLLDPTDGQILVDNAPLTDLRRQWQRSLGYVPQQVHLVDGDLIDNIAFGVPAGLVDLAAVQRAVEMAQLDDVVNDRPDGLRAPVGEDGIRLSGGQRQRIGIARALYHRPSVLVLDEATSALDPATESRITSALESLRGQLTLLIVAHRLTTVRACDELHLLNEGRLVASGTFSGLQRDSEEFAALVRVADLRSGHLP